MSIWNTMSFSKPLFKTLKKPSLFSKIRKISSYEGPSYEAVRTIRKENLSPAMLTYYREPLLIHSGKMQYLYDVYAMRAGHGFVFLQSEFVADSLLRHA